MVCNWERQAFSVLLQRSWIIRMYWSCQGRSLYFSDQLQPLLQSRVQPLKSTLCGNRTLLTWAETSSVKGCSAPLEYESVLELVAWIFFLCPLTCYLSIWWPRQAYFFPFYKIPLNWLIQNHGCTRLMVYRKKNNWNIWYSSILQWSKDQQPSPDPVRSLYLWDAMAN